MKKTLLVIGISTTLLILLGAGWLYWYSVTYQSVPSFVRHIPMFSPDLPQVPLTPGEEVDMGLETEFDLTLQEKALRIPPQYAQGALAEPRNIHIPADAEANVFAAGRGKLRMMAVSPDWWPAGEGILYVTEQQPGNVLALPDRDGDGVADEVVTVIAGLTNPHGIAFYGNALFVATENRIIKYLDFDGNLLPERFEFVVENLPEGGNHVTRTLVFDDAGNMYISVGSSCNVCDEPRRAAVLRYDSEGKNEMLFAEGTRNAVGLVFGPDPWNPGERVLWGTENGRDWLGDDLPPEEVNVLREGFHYGYPYCYADKVPDRTYRSATEEGESVTEFCADTLAPVVKIQAHTAPLGLRFLEGERVPQQLRDNLLVALHGSWNRSVPVGHEILRVSGLVPEEGEGLSPAISTLMSFEPKGARDWGRPVDAIMGADGALYVTDDAAGAIYRLSFTPQESEDTFTPED